MNLLRDVHHAQVFRLLVADLDGRLTVERLADHLSALADATLALTLECAWKAVPRRHRAVPAFAVIAYGKLGGKELGYASDLDLIFLYDDAHPDAAEIYSTLARRLVSWLTTQTSSGHPVRHRSAPAAERQCRPDGVVVRRVLALPAQRRRTRRLGVGDAGADTRALFVRRHCAGRSASRTSALGSWRACATWPHCARRCWRCARRCSTAIPTPARSSTSSTTAAAWSTSSSSCSTWCWPMRTRARSCCAMLGNIALLQMAGAIGLIDASLAHQVADAYRDVSAAPASAAAQWRRARARRAGRGRARSRRRAPAVASGIRRVTKRSTLRALPIDRLGAGRDQPAQRRRLRTGLSADPAVPCDGARGRTERVRFRRRRGRGDGRTARSWCRASGTTACGARRASSSSATAWPPSRGPRSRSSRRGRVCYCYGCWTASARVCAHHRAMPCWRVRCLPISAGWHSDCIERSTMQAP